MSLKSFLILANAVVAVPQKICLLHCEMSRTKAGTCDAGLTRQRSSMKSAATTGSMGLTEALLDNGDKLCEETAEYSLARFVEKRLVGVPNINRIEKAVARVLDEVQGKAVHSFDAIETMGCIFEFLEKWRETMQLRHWSGPTIAFGRLFDQILLKVSERDEGFRDASILATLMQVKGSDITWRDYRNYLQDMSTLMQLAKGIGKKWSYYRNYFRNMMAKGRIGTLIESEEPGFTYVRPATLSYLKEDKALTSIEKIRRDLKYANLSVHFLLVQSKETLSWNAFYDDIIAAVGEEEKETKPRTLEHEMLWGLVPLLETLKEKSRGGGIPLENFSYGLRHANESGTGVLPYYTESGDDSVLNVTMALRNRLCSLIYTNERAENAAKNFLGRITRKPATQEVFMRVALAYLHIYAPEGGCFYDDTSGCALVKESTSRRTSVRQTNTTFA